MQSFLVISKDPKKIEKYIEETSGNFEIHTFDLTIIDNQDKTIGIGEIRNFQKQIFLKPIKSKTKAVVLKNCENLTAEAQNALLKVLEEPPKNTIIILTASSINNFLPTILSRCKIIDYKEKRKVSEEETEDFEKILKEIKNKGVGERLKLAQDLSKNKEETINFLEKVILVARKKLLELDNQEYYLGLIRKIQQTHRIISSTNANLRLMLENLFLNL